MMSSSENEKADEISEEEKNRNAGQVIALTYFALNSWVGIQFVCVFFASSKSFSRSILFSLLYTSFVHSNSLKSCMHFIISAYVVYVHVHILTEMFVVIYCRWHSCCCQLLTIFRLFFSPLSCPRHTLSFQYVDCILFVVCVFFLYFQINNILSGICYCCWLIHLPLLFWLLFSDRLCTYIDQVVTIS